MSLHIAVIYYSSTGNVYQLARALAEGARDAGAEVRLRRVGELASPEVIAQNPAWQAHYEATLEQVPEAQLSDLAWADGYAFGTPTRFGNPAAQLKEFLDRTGGLWAEGKLANKAATAFTSAQSPHGGQESTILALSNVFYHWGCILVPPGYTHPLLFEAGGNPYGTSFIAGTTNAPGEATLAAARYQGHRLVQVAELLTKLREMEQVSA